MFNIEMIRGDTKSVSFVAFQDEDILDLTGATVRFTAKHDYFDADSAAVIKLDNSGLGGISITSASGGEGTITIPKTSTTGLPYHRTDLYYDLKVRDTLSQEFTIARGRLIVFPNATSSI